jgi:DNA replication protein DnaC
MAYDIRTLSYIKQRWLLHSSNIPHRFLGMEPQDIVAKLGKFPKRIDTWLESVLDGRVIMRVGGLGETGVGLLFDGSAGLGKTTHSVVCLTELIRRLPDDDAQIRKLFGYASDSYGVISRPIYYMTVPDFMNRKKAMIDAEPAERREMQLQMEGFHGRSAMDHLNVRVLVLDDLGKELKSEYNAAGFDELLRARYDKGLPTIVTTNMSLSSWKDKYGEAMESFAHEAFQRIIIGEVDLRRGN